MDVRPSFDTHQFEFCFHNKHKIQFNWFHDRSNYLCDGYKFDVFHFFFRRDFVKNRVWFELIGEAEKKRKIIESVFKSFLVHFLMFWHILPFQKVIDALTLKFIFIVSVGVFSLIWYFENRALIVFLYSWFRNENALLWK